MAVKLRQDLSHMHDSQVTPRLQYAVDQLCLDEEMMDKLLEETEGTHES